MTTTAVRIPARMADWWAGSEVWTKPDTDVLGCLLEKVKAAGRRKDGSRVVKLTPGEAAELEEWAGYLAAAAADDAGWDPDARADLNAARATIRQARAARGG